jgi:HTH-type transcriptional repressor of NAD biosynthesis genes
MEKEFKRGLVLGKFFIPHKGHLYLIDTAISQCEKVYVMVCSLQREHVPGHLRYKWLKKIYKNNKNVKIIHCEDEYPQTPEEANSVDEFYNEYWCKSVYSRIKKLDVIFTSENYGEEFAKYLKIKHVLVDLDRKIFPISGTKARTETYKYWEYIPDIIKSYFAVKVVVLGPESTGKSTLVKNLANWYGCDFIEEYGRNYTEEIKEVLSLEKKDFINIAKNHFKISKNKIKDNNKKLLFFDTEAITTKIFGEFYLNNFKSKKIDKIISKQNFDIILLLNTDVEWINDGTRTFSDKNKRQEHFLKIKSELEKNNLNFHIISGTDYFERLKDSKIIIDNFCKNNKTKTVF